MDRSSSIRKVLRESAFVAAIIWAVLLTVILIVMSGQAASANSRVNKEIVEMCTAKFDMKGAAGYQKLEYCRDLAKEISNMPRVEYSLASARHFSFWRCMEAVQGETGMDFSSQTGMCINHINEIEP